MLRLCHAAARLLGEIAIAQAISSIATHFYVAWHSSLCLSLVALVHLA